VQPANVEGLSFRPEVETVNALVPEVRAKGATAIVVLVHQGAVPEPETPYKGCGLDIGGQNSALERMAEHLDPAVLAIVSAHTHRAYVCELAGKTVTSAASYGRVITAIDLTFQDHKVVKRAAKNVAVTHDLPKDGAVDALVQSYVDASAPRANRVIGHVTSDLLARPVGAESNLGDFIADAMLASTSAKDAGGAVLAFMNPGGIRADIRVAPSGSEPPGTVTFGKIFAAQPFGNILYTLTLSGKGLLDTLEEQFHGPDIRFLQPSKGFTYTFVPNAEVGHHVVPGSAKLDGVPIDPSKSYRVTVSDFLYNGGDGHKAFHAGADVRVGPVDVEALEKYFASFGSGAAPVASPNAGRVKNTVEKK
jgi:5'-nucleotidase